MKGAIAVLECAGCEGGRHCKGAAARDADRRANAGANVSPSHSHAHKPVFIRMLQSLPANCESSSMNVKHKGSIRGSASLQSEL